VLGARGQSPSTRGLFEREAADVLVEHALDLLELRAHRFLRFIERLGEIVDAHGIARQKKDGLQGRA
jgi:hypothetical protein